MTSNPKETTTDLAVAVNEKPADPHLDDIDYSSDEDNGKHILSEKDRQLNELIEREILEHPNRLPKATRFIIPNEFCERFYYYGINPLLMKYFRDFIGADQTKAKMYTHQFGSCVYFFPLLGGAISDSFLGKYHTIVYLSMVYVLGGILLVAVSFPGLLGIPNTSNPIPLWGPALSLFLIALGAGGIKACVSAHGGDQYLKHQEKAITLFFTLFYTAINLGALISGYLTPLLKEINCFNTFPQTDGSYGGDCYPLAYGVPCVLLIIATLTFIIGKRFYRIKPPIGEFLPWKMVVITTTALKGWWHDKSGKRKPFLDYSAQRFGMKWVHEARAFWHMNAMIAPSILINAIYNQSFTEFQYQYEKMNPKAFGLITIIPEQSSNINTVMVLLTATTVALWVYPFMEKFMVLTAQRKVLIGYLLVCFAFFSAGILNYFVEANSHPVLNAKGEIESCENCLNGAWQWIPFFFMSLGEVIWNITQLEYSYTAVGKRMKSSASAMNLLYNSLGNELVVVVEQLLTYEEGGVKKQYISTGDKYYFWTGIGLVAVAIHLLLMWKMKSPR